MCHNCHAVITLGHSWTWLLLSSLWYAYLYVFCCVVTVSCGFDCFSVCRCFQTSFWRTCTGFVALLLFKLANSRKSWYQIFCSCSRPKAFYLAEYREPQKTSPFPAQINVSCIHLQNVNRVIFYSLLKLFTLILF